MSTVEFVDLRAVAADDDDIEAVRAGREWGPGDDPAREWLLRMLAGWRADVQGPRACPR